MPTPPRAEVVDTVGGVRVADPYRPLEDLSAASPWIDAQNARTDAWFAAHRRAEVEARLEQLFAIGALGSPSFAGDAVFYLRKSGGQEQSALYVRRGEKPPEVVVDPNALDASGRTTIDWYYPSDDGRLLAYGTSKDGDEISTLRVLDTQTGEHRAESIAFTRACSLVWLPDASAFYYTRYPGAEAYNRHVYFHRLGTSAEDDPRIVGPERLTDRADWVSLALSPDGEQLLAIRFIGWAESTLHLLDIAAGTWTDIAPAEAGQFVGGEVVDGQIWAVSDHGHPRRRLVRIDPAKPDPASWVEVIAESEEPLEGTAMLPDGVLAYHLRNAAAHVRFYDRQGQVRAELPTPVTGSVSGWFAKPTDDRVLLVFESFFYPPTLLRATAAAPQPVVVDAVESGLDTSAYVVDAVEYPSYDGTRVPMFLIHRKGIARDRSHRTLLYGYGGFNVSLTPVFSRNVLYWLEQGGVYAVANLRGGGERGEAWHRAGMLDRKFQVFQDFEYAARYLLREGYTRPDRLAILGGSNGGLLMGAMLTRAPHLFGAVVTKVGLYDMLRYHLFPPAELWVKEYGSAEDAEQAPWMWAYSPYHQVIDGVRYPAVLATTAEKDTRVHWAHTAKFVAALQAAQVGDAPILMRFERAAGHGAGKATSKVVLEYAEVYQFLLGVLAP